MANYCWLTPLLKFAPGIPTFVLAPDISSQRLAPSANGQTPDPGTPEGETALLDLAGNILAISEEDAAVFREFLPGKPIQKLPKAAIPQRHREPVVDNLCLFVGGLNQPNQEGIAWFLAEAWPLIRTANPAAVLHVCGAIGTVLTGKDEGVVIRGRIDDLSAEYAKASVVIVPLLSGSGVKIKLIEACSHGKACVTTPIGLQGLSFFRDAVEVADDAPAFAAAVGKALGDFSLRQKLGEAALAAVQSHLSARECYEPLFQKLRGA